MKTPYVCLYGGLCLVRIVFIMKRWELEGRVDYHVTSCEELFMVFYNYPGRQRCIVSNVVCPSTEHPKLIFSMYASACVRACVRACVHSCICDQVFSKITL